LACLKFSGSTIQGEAIVDGLFGGLFGEFGQAIAGLTAQGFDSIHILLICLWLMLAQARFTPR
jgi:hypothetical protein